MLDEQRPNVAIGRAEDNDLVIKGNLISRLHARIEINRNKFVLIDQSTNGDVRAGRGWRRVVRPPRQHADQRRGADRLRPGAGARLAADRSASTAKNESSLDYRGASRLAFELSAPSRRRARRRIRSGTCAIVRDFLAPRRRRPRPAAPHRRVADISAREVEVRLRGQVADRRFVRLDPAVAAFEDPLQHAQVVAVARPQELAVLVPAEPVDVEDARQLSAGLRTQPVRPVVAEVVAAEGLHRHRVATHDAHLRRPPQPWSRTPCRRRRARHAASCALRRPAARLRGGGRRTRSPRSARRPALRAASSRSGSSSRRP